MLLNKWKDQVKVGQTGVMVLSVLFSGVMLCSGCSEETKEDNIPSTTLSEQNSQETNTESSVENTTNNADASLEGSTDSSSSSASTNNG